MTPALRRATSAMATAALLVVASASAVPAQDGPIVGTPDPVDAAEGWVSTYTTPDYWTAWSTDVVEDGHVNLVVPADPVKPEAYLPNVPVADDDSYVSALPVDLIEWEDFTYTFDGETKTMEQFLTTTRTDVVVVVRDGTVVGEWYRNGYGPDVRHQPWSVTKTYIAAVVGIAFEEELIGSLQDPIDDYIPELAGTSWEGVSIENILQMESGVHWDEDDPILAQNTQVEQWADLALDLYTEGEQGQTRNEFLATLPPMGYEQGTEFRYNSGNTQVLAWLTERLYDMPFNEVLSQKLWIPMGADGDAVMTSDRVGSVIASHGLFARPYDFARFGELLRNNGETPEGHEIISEEWVEAMTTMTEVSEGRYGYQTWNLKGADGYTASGFQGQKISVMPDSCTTAVRLSHAFGIDGRDGDDPTDPDAYGFSTEFYSDEWGAMLAAAATYVGGCG